MPTRNGSLAEAESDAGCADAASEKGSADAAQEGVGGTESGGRVASVMAEAGDDTDAEWFAC
jgi:hypothetical protein